MGVGFGRSRGESSLTRRAECEEFFRTVTEACNLPSLDSQNGNGEAFTCFPVLSSAALPIIYNEYSWNSHGRMTTVRLLDEPQGWRSLQHMAHQETDPQRLALIIEQMNRLLDFHEKRMASGQDRENKGDVGDSDYPDCSAA